MAEELLLQFNTQVCEIGIAKRVEGGSALDFAWEHVNRSGGTDFVRIHDMGGDGGREGGNHRNLFLDQERQ